MLKKILSGIGHVLLFFLAIPYYAAISEEVWRPRGVCTPMKGGFFLTLILTVILFVVQELMKPKPDSEAARPDNIGDFQFPTATESRIIPIVFGTVKLSGPNVIWYGDLQQIPITERIKTGLFSKKTITTGFRYLVGIQYALCRGPIEALTGIWVGEDKIFTGSQGAGDLDISEPGLFGGDEFGNGGINGTLAVFTGTTTQTASPYLSTFQQEGGDTPAYRGTTYCVWEKGYIGNSSTITKWAFEVQRFPNGLGFTNAKNKLNGSKDVNPVSVIYELLTNDEWGLALSPSDIDTVNFSSVGTVMQTESNGFSMTVDRTMEALDLLRELERQIDGNIDVDRMTGLWTIKLVRSGDTSLGSIDETNQITMKDFSRNAWEDTSNQVRIQFSDRSRDYFETHALAQDLANFQITGENTPADAKYPGVKDPDLANRIAWRELKTLSTPLAKTTLVVDRSFWNARVGDLVEWSNSTLGITSLDMRVIKVDIGDLVNGQITLKLVEDVFSADPASFAPPQPTGWEPPVDVVVDIPEADRSVFEAPKAISDRDPIFPGVSGRIWAGARPQGDNAIQFDIVVAGNTEGTTVGFFRAGKLFSAVTRDSTASIILKPDPDSQADMLAQFQAITNTDKGVSLSQLVLINGEFISVTDASASGLNVSLDTPTRGMLDTTPAEHAIDDVCYLIFVFGNLTDGSFVPSTVSTELLPESPTDKLTTAEATNFNVTLDNRDLKPYPPVRPRIASFEYNGGTVQLDTNVGASDDMLGYTVDFTRRDFRTADEYLAQLNEDSLPNDFPTNNTTEYRVNVIDDPDGSATSLFLTPWSADGDDSNQILIGRTEILANNGAVVPTKMRIEVQTRHLFGSEIVEREADKVLQWDFDVASVELDPGDQVLGTGANGVSLTAFIAATTGNYTVAIGSNTLVNGIVEENVNAGGFVPTGIAAGVTSAVRPYTATDSVVFRVNGETPVLNLNTILKVDDQAIGDTSDGHGVFTL